MFLNTSCIITCGRRMYCHFTFSAKLTGKKDEHIHKTIPKGRRMTEKEAFLRSWLAEKKSVWQDSDDDYYDSGYVCALLLKLPSANMTKSIILQQGCSRAESLPHCWLIVAIIIMKSTKSTEQCASKKKPHSLTNAIAFIFLTWVAALSLEDFFAVLLPH